MILAEYHIGPYLTLTSAPVATSSGLCGGGIGDSNGPSASSFASSSASSIFSSSAPSTAFSSSASSSSLSLFLLLRGLGLGLCRTHATSSGSQRSADFLKPSQWTRTSGPWAPSRRAMTLPGYQWPRSSPMISVPTSSGDSSSRWRSSSSSAALAAAAAASLAACASFRAASLAAAAASRASLAACLAAAASAAAASAAAFIAAASSATARSAANLSASAFSATLRGLSCGDGIDTAPPLSATHLSHRLLQFLKCTKASAPPSRSASTLAEYHCP